MIYDDNWHIPIEAEKPPANGFVSRGFIKSPKWLPIGRQPPTPFFFLDFDDNLRFRVWIPSFFIVNGRFTCKYETNYFIILFRIIKSSSLGSLFIPKENTLYEKKTVKNNFPFFLVCGVCVFLFTFHKSERNVSTESWANEFRHGRLSDDRNTSLEQIVACYLRNILSRWLISLFLGDLNYSEFKKGLFGCDDIWLENYMTYEF
jgi:hypothetical protein